MTDDEESNNKENIKQSKKQKDLTPSLSTAPKLHYEYIILSKEKDVEDNI